MKKIIIIVWIIMSCSTLTAAEGPFSTGSKSISGIISYVNLSGEAYSDVEILELTPSITRCLSYGFFLGGAVRIRHLSLQGSSATQWQVGGILERYFTFEADGGGKLIPFFKASILIGNDSSINQFSLKNDIGLIKMVSKTVGVEFAIQGTYDNYFSDGYSVTGYILQAGFGFKTFIF